MSHYGTVRNYQDGSVAWKKKSDRWRLKGLYTDDTQQALALADVLLAFGHVDVDRLAALYLELLAEPTESFCGAHRGVGRSFRQVLTQLQMGVSPRESGQVDSAGAGAAMRITPVPLYFADEPERILDAVLDASLMTHRDCRSLGAALAVAHAVRRLAAGAPRSASLLFLVADDVLQGERAMKDRTRGQVATLDDHPHSLSTAIARVERILDAPRERALTALVQEANLHGAEPLCRRPTMGFAPALVPTCLYLLLTTDSFEDALIDVVNLGGDADTAGAVLGAMAGAHYGVEAIPSRWLDGLQNRQGIEARADALVARSTEGLDVPDLVATERSLSRREAASRDDLKNLQNQSGGDMGANRRL
jgi:ADP-ribosylglycohydrolase